MSTNKDRTNTQAGFISIFMKITHPSSFRIFFVQRLKVELSFANTLKYLPFPNIAHSFLSLPAFPPPPLYFSSQVLSFLSLPAFPPPSPPLYFSSQVLRYSRHPTSICLRLLPLRVESYPELLWFYFTSLFDWFRKLAPLFDQ